MKLQIKKMHGIMEEIPLRNSNNIYEAPSQFNGQNNKKLNLKTSDNKQFQIQFLTVFDILY